MDGKFSEKEKLIRGGELALFFFLLYETGNKQKCGRRRLLLLLATRVNEGGARLHGTRDVGRAVVAIGY